MESEIISSENVRPSSPTPLHLQIYKFSTLDEIAPSMLVPVVLYYPNTEKPSHPDLSTSQLLKHSLSLILTRFYPLAGRISADCQYIDCNDYGVPFSVARINARKLSDLLRNPDLQLPRLLLPCDITWEAESPPDSTVAMIKITYFDCGGISIGAVFCHKLVDAVTIYNFLNSWAATTHRSGQPVCPNYISQSIFPFKEEIPRQSGSISDLLKTGKPIMKRYVFDGSAISSLKAKIVDVQNPTRVEGLTRRFHQIVLEISLGWRWRSARTMASQSKNVIHIPPIYFNLGYLVTKIRDAVRKIDEDLINRLLGDDGFLGYRENLQQTSGVTESADLMTISSWCGFGWYTADFGWGKPMWLTRCNAGSDSETRFLHDVMLIDTRNGDGIEA
ncbi:UNVERIFIED_CONTAM: (13S,14R)-1,13-dihydroxy-N-methylcanadine 13-O-acetyltransferase AT1 [Sesamum radiatum]|uniref:(13S,14R)-1,13-dihydroxy-N-methylcanadine 13-O-acetyltransferase AT1 n=1 Tax=Sesamum radiatum TaxID=300843 RepID=A0AAW2R1D3_SESRA